MPILNEETFLESGKLREISKAEIWTHVLRAQLHVWTFVVCLHQKSHDTTREI